MGKKTEKLASKEKATVQPTEDVVNKTPEPYQCVGNFNTDFTELFRERNPGYQIPIIVRNKRGFSPTGFPSDSNTNIQVSKKGNKEEKKGSLIQHQLDPDQISQEDKDIISAIKFKPRTFAVKPTFNALKPSIYVETDNVDKPDNITEISIRRWKVDLVIVDVLAQCFSPLTKLTSITLWRVGLTSEAISQLAETLSKCEPIKFLTIENNQEAKLENYHELIKAGSHLTKLHLRYCNITPEGAKLLADELGTLTNTGNSKLLVLDLSGCPLGEFGALYLVKALKINRTLLSLSLSNCDVGDTACIEMAKMISRYFLTDVEIFARRQLMSERTMSESAKSVSGAYRHKLSFSRESICSINLSPPLSRRGDSKDRPVSVRSSSKEDKNKKEKGNVAKSKKDVKEEKHEKVPPKGKKDDKNPAVKKASVAIDISKTVSKSRGGRSSKMLKTTNQVDTTSEAASENMDNIHPLLQKVDPVEPGKLLITGNFVLLMLNLSRNRITEEGLEELSAAVSYQVSMIPSMKSNRTGLLKLFLQGNEFNIANEKYVKIQNLLSSRDPKTKSSSLEVE